MIGICGGGVADIALAKSRCGAKCAVLFSNFTGHTDLTMQQPLT